MTSTPPDLLVRDRLGGWACQWDRLVAASAVPSPFMRSWWLAGTAGAHPRFLLIARNGQLLGGLALEEERRLGVPWLRMMGAGPLCPDHLDLLAAPGQQDTVISLLQRWLSRPGSRLLDLEGVLGTSRLATALPGSVRCEPMAVAPWSPMAADAAQYIAARPALFRRNLRRASGRLSAAGAMHRVNRGSAAVERLEVLRQLHEAQWGDRSNFLPSFDTFAAGCRLAAQFDEIAVHELRAGKIIVAILVAFEVAQRLSLYQGARLTDSQWREASTVLLSAAITDACERGFNEVDFLRGDEPYKRNFTSRSRELLRIQTASGWSSKLALIAQTSARKARPLIVIAAQRGKHAMHETTGKGLFETMDRRHDIDVTVVTPTFNRAHTLRRAYASLRDQSLSNFEWLIVDDGSSDGTERLIAELGIDAPFPIRYLSQQHSGKHVARNRAVAEANGRFFVGLDSDDWLLPNALATLLNAWESIPLPRRDQFIGVAGRCALPDGTKIGGNLPTEVLDSDEVELRNRLYIRGDNAGMNRTDVLRAYPMPEIEGQNFVTEAVVQNRIAREYKTRYFDEVVKICDYQRGGLSDRSRLARMQNAPSSLDYYSELLSMRERLGIRSRYRASVNFVRYAKHSGRGIWHTHDEVAFGMWIASLPVALYFCAGDRRMQRRLDSAVSPPTPRPPD